jgi:hypothetical protein
MSMVIEFDQLSVGDVVSNHFLANQGVAFASLFSPAKSSCLVVSDTNASGGKALRASQDVGDDVFQLFGLSGTFASAKHSRIGISVNAFVRLTARDKMGTEIGHVFVTPGNAKLAGDTDGTYFSGEFAASTANIASFEIFTPGPFSISRVEFDDLTVEHQPDFRLMPNNQPPWGESELPDTPWDSHGKALRLDRTHQLQCHNSTVGCSLQLQLHPQPFRRRRWDEHIDLGMGKRDCS